MAFINGFRSRGGVLLNKVWSFGTSNVDSFGWRQPPGWQGDYGNCSIGSGYIGSADGDMLNAVLIPIDPLAAGGGITDALYASFDIEGHQDYKRELRFLVSSEFSQTGPDRYDGVYKVKPYLRVYSDATTYTDYALGTNPQSVQIHRNDGSGVYERTTGIVFANVMYSGHHYVLIGAAVSQDQNSTIKYLAEYTYYDYNTFFQTLGGEPEAEKFSPEFGDASEPEGYTGGTFDDHSDPVDFPTDPQSIIGLGFVNVYKCEANSLIDFGEALFPKIQFPQSLSDVGEVIAAVSDSIWNAKLIDYVVSVHCVPGDVLAGNLEDIKVGARTMTGILARKVTTEYVTIDFGSLETGRIFRNYADVMTGCKIFLPFYGFVDLAPEYWNGCTLTVKYKVNVIDGSFMAYIKASDCYYSKLNGIIGQYGGTCCIHIPTTGGNYASLFSTLVGASTAGVMNAAKGNIVGAASNLMEVGMGMAGGGSVHGGGSYNASSSFMSMRQSFLLIDIPVPSFSERYNAEKGLPSNVTFTLGSLNGFTTCDDPEITFACEEDEAEEIRKLLKSGVIL